MFRKLPTRFKHSKRSTKILLISSAIELGVIGILAMNIFKGQGSVLGTQVGVAPIPAEYVTRQPVDGLNYFYRLNPSVTWHMSPYRLNYQVAYTMNNDGLNDRYDYAQEKPEKTYRILTLGDSYTFGIGVNTDENYSELLEDHLNKQAVCPTVEKYEVLNLGVPGFDPEYEIAHLKNTGLKYSPDLITFLFIDNDFDQSNELMLPKRMAYQQQMAENGELKKARDAGIIYPYWLKAMNETYAEVGGKEVVTNRQQHALQQLNSLFSGPILLTHFNRLAKEYKQVIADMASRRPNTYVYSELGKSNLSSNSQPDGHPSASAHQGIANELFSYLQKTHLLPCE
jgi:hypothetical protein